MEPKSILTSNPETANITIPLETINTFAEELKCRTGSISDAPKLDNNLDTPIKSGEKSRKGGPGRGRRAGQVPTRKRFTHKKRKKSVPQSTNCTESTTPVCSTSTQVRFITVVVKTGL